MDNFIKMMKFQVETPIIYNALTSSIPKWWTEMFEGIANEQGQSFTVRFGPHVFKTMIVEELIPERRVVWKVTDSVIEGFDLKNKTEWVDTRIVWEISIVGKDAVLDLTHIGLTPAKECFNICESGWQSFTDSLTGFINTGIGTPFTTNIR